MKLKLFGVVILVGQEAVDREINRATTKLEIKNAALIFQLKMIEQKRERQRNNLRKWIGIDWSKAEQDDGK